MDYHDKIVKLKEAGFINESEAIELEKEADAAAEITKTLASDINIIKEAKISIGNIAKWLNDHRFELSMGLGSISAIAAGGEMLKHQIDRKRMYGKMLSEYPQLKDKYSDKELRRAYNVVADYMPNLLKNPVVLAGAVRQIAEANNEEREPGVDPGRIGSMVSDANMIGSGTSFYTRNTGQGFKKMVGEGLSGVSYPIAMQTQELQSRYEALKKQLQSMETERAELEKALTQGTVNVAGNKIYPNEMQRTVIKAQIDELGYQAAQIKQLIQQLEQSGTIAGAEAQKAIADTMRQMGREMAEKGTVTPPRFSGGGNTGGGRNF